MPSSSSERVTCPDCGKGYRWQSNLVGRKVTCKACGSEFEVPSAPGEGIAIEPEPVADDGTYELDLDTDEPQAAQASHAAPSNNGKCPVCNTPVRDGAVICMNCGFNMAEGKRMETAVAGTPTTEAPEEPPLSQQEQREVDRVAAANAHSFWVDYKLPLIVVGIGLAMVLVNNLILGPMSPWVKGMYGDTLSTIIGLTIRTAYVTFVHSVLLFVGLLLLVKLFGAAFGTLTSVLLRVLGVTLVAQEADFMVMAIMDIAMGTGGLGWFVSWAIYLAFMIGLCVKLLDVDFTEFRVLIWFIIIGQFVTDYTFVRIIDLFL